jgi:type IV pilus assembly protein PilA
LASGAKATIGENIATGATTTLCTGVTTFTTPVGHVASLACDNASGKLTITMRDTAQSAAFTLTPNTAGAETTGAITWACAPANSTKDKYLPAECRATAAEEE